MTYDHRCYDLAATFLGYEAIKSDTPELMNALRADLAQLIQDTIGDYISVDLPAMRKQYAEAISPQAREVRS